VPERPQLVENLTGGTTHAAALAFLVDDIDPRFALDVATGYVNLGGLHHVATAVTDGRRVRLLLGAVPGPGLGVELPLSRFEVALQALVAERDLSRFPPSRAAARLLEVDVWLNRPELEVRRYVSRFLHGKAYLFGDVGDGRAALVTSANLTTAGLLSNLELGLVHYDPHVARLALEWFDGLWTSAVDFKENLRSLLFPDPGLLDPETIYLRALLELYGDDLETPLDSVATGSSAVALAPFQRDGYERARRIVAEHHGVVYADGVGTGKTEIGLAFIEEYALRRGQHALVVAPAQLVANWQERIDQARLPAQVVSYQQLAVDEQLVSDARVRRRVLHNAADSYRLVVVDEGHSLRNPDTTWYRAAERLLGGERKDLVLLTATPVNNGLWDLYHLVMAFARHDRAFAAQGIASARQLFVDAGANAKDPENLDPDALFPLADAVSVRRDRRFIEAHYPGATFPDGTPVRFPRPQLRTLRYDLDAVEPGLIAEMTGLIESLSMARYRPSAFEVGGAEAANEASLGGLLQSGILKRFESCWWSCLATVRRMVTAHDSFLAAWEAGIVPSRSALREAALAEADDAGLAGWVADSLVDDEARPTSDFLPTYGEAVAADRVTLAAITARLDRLSAGDDPKLARLRLLLDEAPWAKIAVFATFGDTVRYLDAHLPATVGGRERVVVIGGESDPDSRATLLGRFCPDTVVRPGYVPPDGEVDLLISTDVLSEGQNLQQAEAVVSYDMPWNPQRVVQRNGRVIRLKSPHEDVFLTTMLPEDGDLEALLRLEAAIRRKILAANVYGMETGVIEDVEPELRSYAARLAGGDPSLLDDGGASGSFAGEELRAHLQRAMAEGETARLRALPWGVGASFRQGPGVPSTGAAGIFFACRTVDGARYWRYVEDDGTVLDGDSEMLRRIAPGAAPGLEPAAAGLDLEAAWSPAVASIVDEHNRRADPRADAERIGPAQRFALDLLRDPVVALPAGAGLAEEALSVERSTSVRHALSEVRRLLVAGQLSRDEGARRVVDVVTELGLQPVEPPPALSPITADDIGVVCWMAVRPER
jgi:superfamily II DNA or RNA helicase